MKKAIFVSLVFLLAACQPVSQTLEVTGTSRPPTRIPEPTLAQTAEPILTLTTEPISTPESEENAYQICCPLEEETLETLPLIIVNPLNIPPFGQDIGHHGVDYAYYRRGTRASIEGIEIYAILSGKTVMTLDDDIPYGYTIMIETPLSDLPDTLQKELMAGYLPVPADPNYRLYCPEVGTPDLTGEYSVYHLYAHMEVRPPFNTGDPIGCGQNLGTVGNTGYSSNPHLHLETRLGPSKANFETLAHYENTNTIEQMANYCLWRMSGHYQLFDPELLFYGGQ